MLNGQKIRIIVLDLVDYDNIGTIKLYKNRAKTSKLRMSITKL